VIGAPASGSALPPAKVPPGAVVASASLNGRLLTVALICDGDGSVQVSYRRHSVGASQFTCATSRQATARLRLSTRVARKLKADRKARVTVTVRVGTVVTNRTVKVGRAKATGKAAAWPAPWQVANGQFYAVGSCEASGNNPPQSTYSLGAALSSTLPGGDYWALSFWARFSNGVVFTEAVRLPLTTGGFWSDYYPVRQTPGWWPVVGPLFKLPPGIWSTVYMKIFSWKTKQVVGDYLLTTTTALPPFNRTSGVWCVSTY
jgi:hypothetical protein